MTKHFHRGDGILIIGDTTYFKVLEGKYLWVGVDGSFLTRFNSTGKYLGVRSLSAGKFPYYRIRVGSTKGAYAHRVVFEVISGSEIPEGLEVDHINGVATDNRFDNLRVVTKMENMRNPITHKRLVDNLRRLRADPEVESLRVKNHLSAVTAPGFREIQRKHALRINLGKRR